MSEPAVPSIAFVPRNRLSEILTAMDRDTFASHIEKAAVEVRRIAPAISASIGEDVQTLIHLCRQDEAELFGQCREIGWLALRIVESARLAQRPALAETARGVWEMVEALSEKGVWHTDALRLHAEALQALKSAPAMDGGACKLIQDELVRMRAAVGAATLLNADLAP